MKNLRWIFKLKFKLKEALIEIGLSYNWHLNYCIKYVILKQMEKIKKYILSSKK